MLQLLSLLLASAAVVLGQGSFLPDITTPAQPVITDCSGCYVIAGVAQVLFGESQIVQTQTAIVSQGTGRNGSTVTTTFLQPLGEFSFDPSGIISGGPVTGEFAFPTGTLITISGATLTSPTAYNVFTAYTVTSLVQNGGVCSTLVGQAQAVSPAFSIAIPEGSGPDFIFEAESSFVNNLPQLTCQAAGVAVSTTTAIPVTTTTTTSTTSGLIRPTPIAQSTAAAPTPTSVSGISISTIVSSSTTIYQSYTQSFVVVSGTPSPTNIIIIGAAASIIVPSWSVGLFAALFVVPGLAAWLL